MRDEYRRVQGFWESLEPQRALRSTEDRKAEGRTFTTKDTKDKKDLKAFGRRMIGK
jgi:hypothetical protein